MRQIQIVIGKDGAAKIETSGYSGNVCEQTVNELLISVGATEESQTEKPEYYNGDDGLMDEIFNSNM